MREEIVLSIREFSRYFSRYKHKDVLVVENGRVVGQWLGGSKEDTEVIEQEIAHEVANNETKLVGGGKLSVSDILKETGETSDSSVGQKKDIGSLRELVDKTAEKFAVPKVDPVIAERMRQMYNKR